MTERSPEDCLDVANRPRRKTGFEFAIQKHLNVLRRKLREMDAAQVRIEMVAHELLIVLERADPDTGTRAVLEPMLKEPADGLAFRDGSCINKRNTTQAWTVLLLFIHFRSMMRTVIEKKEKLVMIRVTVEQKRIIAKVGGAAGLELSSWMRALRSKKRGGWE